MAKSSSKYPRRRWARFVFLLLIIIPFIPEIVICAAALAAHLKGCQVDQKDVCLIGSLPVSDIIGWALQVSAGLVLAVATSSNKWLFGFLGAVVGWLVICHVLLLLGWARAWSRLLLGFVATLIFAILPYWGPMLAVASFTDGNCALNEGGVGSCEAFGGYVGASRHTTDAVALSLLALIGAPLATGVFVIYGIVVIALSVVSAKSGFRSG